MTKVRVHELAKELNKSNKEILDFLQEKKDFQKGRNKNRCHSR